MLVTTEYMQETLIFAARELAKSGQIISAIKCYRAGAGCDLKEAKTYCERFYITGVTVPTHFTDDARMQRIEDRLSLLEKANSIDGY